VVVKGGLKRAASSLIWRKALRTAPRAVKVTVGYLAAASKVGVATIRRTEVIERGYIGLGEPIRITEVTSLPTHRGVVLQPQLTRTLHWGLETEL